MKNRMFLLIAGMVFAAACNERAEELAQPVKLTQSDEINTSPPPSDIPLDKPIELWEDNGVDDCYPFYCDCIVIRPERLNTLNEGLVGDFEDAVQSGLVEQYFNGSDYQNVSNIRHQQLFDLQSGFTTVVQESGRNHFFLVYSDSLNIRADYPSWDIY